MKIDQKSFGDVVVVTLEGNLVALPDAAALRQVVYDLLAKEKKCVVLDLAGVPAINSSGLGAMVAALTSLRRRGGDLRLAHLSRKVEGTLAITHLIHIFQIYEDTRRAIRSFEKNPANAE